VSVQVREETKGTSRDAIVALLARAEAADGHPPLPDPQHHAVLAGAGDVRLLLVELDGTLAAFGVLSRSTDGSSALHLVFDPDHRDGADARALGDALITAALDLGVAPLHFWAMQADQRDDELASRHGFEPERSLVQMRVPLPLPSDVVSGAPQVRTRPFQPGRDDQAWLDVNNRAFAGHREQGNWTEAELRSRLTADWFVADGFLVAEADDSVLIGSCWTKVHRGTTPPMGEIYIISVDPDQHGQGLGKALTVAGLVWLAEQGITVGMLYTDDDNEAALALYRSLGFTVDHVDRSYIRPNQQGTTTTV
jgi:mycothiol synthase